MVSNISIISHKNKQSLTIDCLLVLFNIINGGLAILPFLLIDSIPYNLLLGVIFNIVWCIVNSRFIKPFFSLKTLIPFFCILFYQLLLGRLEFSITILVLDISFLFVLFGMQGKYKEQALTLLSNIYIFYSICNVIGVCLSFILIQIGLLSPNTNSLYLNIITSDDGVAFFPGYLSVIRPGDTIRVSFIRYFGVFCGFSHEPHVAGYVCLPAFFLLLDKCRKIAILKVVIIFLYTLFFLITLSATSFLSVSIVTFLGLFMAGAQKGNRKCWLILVILIIIIILAASFIGEAFSFVFDKMSASDGSGDYSKDRIAYAFSPKTLFGTTIYSTSIDGDIGVITMLLNIWYYVSAGLLCLKMLKSNNRDVFYYGLALLYFLCHSMKIFTMVYRFPYTVFLIFLSYMVLNNIEKKKTRYIAQDLG